MSAVIEQLVAVLEDSEKMYQQLLPVLDREKEAAFGSQPEVFKTVIEEKEEILAHLHRMDCKRREFVGKLAAQWDIPVKAFRLSTVADKSDGLQSSKIRRLRSSLKGLTREVKQRNEENRIMIQHCLDLVQGTMSFFQHWIMPKDVYGSSGQMNMHQRNGSLISGAV